jgi:hypothetical protein
MIAQEPPIDPYSLPMVKAACGTEGVSAASVAKRAPSAAPALEAGKARVYVITEKWGLLGSRGEPVLLGLDGRWFGANRFYNFGFTFVDVDPGIHHLCVASTMKSVLPHTSVAVALARMNAVAGQTYYFYNRCIKIAGIFTLQPINADEGTMDIQALPSNGLPKLWKTPAVLAACGPNPNHVPKDPQLTPNLPGPPAPGSALVYFFHGIIDFGSYGVPIRIGMDGRWAGETHMGSYVALQVTPGVHRLCSATPLVLGDKPILWLGELDAVAGETYFVDTTTLQPADDSLVTYLLRRIAAMPKTDTPDPEALAKWNQAHLPYSQSELRACGIPPVGNTSLPPSSAETADGSSGSFPHVYFLLNTNVKMLPLRNAVNVGLDGRWAASLRSRSWVSLALAPGKHDVCIHFQSGVGWKAPVIVPAKTLYLASVNAVDGGDLYFASTLMDYGEGGDIFLNDRLDPDEGAMLVALYPQASLPYP